MATIFVCIVALISDSCVLSLLHIGVIDIFENHHFASRKRYTQQVHSRYSRYVCYYCISNLISLCSRSSLRSLANVPLCEHGDGFWPDFHRDVVVIFRSQQIKSNVCNRIWSLSDFCLFDSHIHESSVARIDSCSLFVCIY